MKNDSTNIMMIAGEVSGDLHGAAIIRQLKEIDSQINFFGIGGDEMKAEGMSVAFHIKEMSFLGFAEVVKHIPFIKKVQKHLLEVIKEKNINNIVLIDYPGFNLNFAKKLKKNNKNVIYYISPQIWAWASGRIKKIKNLVDKMLVVFHFEEDLYKKEGVDVEFVGHPLIDRINEHNFLSRDELFKKYELDPAKDILLIMPGSRKQEVEKIFPEVVKAVAKLCEKHNLQPVVAASLNVDENLFKQIASSDFIKIINGNTYDLLKHSKIGIVKSGTSTLESGILGLPIVIVYKTSGLTYLIGKSLVKIKNIGLVNIVLGEEAVPELIQDEANAENIFDRCNKILSDSDYYRQIKSKLENVKEKLGSIGASRNAANSIYKLLNET